VNNYVMAPRHGFVEEDWLWQTQTCS
jgi:hypothetical protein